MDIIISHQSALEYWRQHRKLPKSVTHRRQTITLPDKPPATNQIVSLGLTLPVHVTISKPNTRWLSITMKQHVFAGKIPIACFIDTENNFMVSSPELCYLQMASQLPLIELIELGYEMCGRYSIPNAKAEETSESGFYRRDPLTNKKKLAAFISRMKGAKWHKKAIRALRYIQDGSASPMETKLTILLTLPYQLGGFGLLMPDMNSRIVPTKTARQSSSKGFYVCDLFWPEYNLAVEYDSDLFHTGSQHIADDSKKRNALALLGITTITVTKQQLYSYSEMIKVAKVLANYMDKRLKLKNPGFANANLELRKQLL
ncbi:MAG: hypothetical protein LBU61_06880 [Coriobacteriales bacterium]|jgi:hypothetical protein|nr:hypothetical protein [Coriobacteriales bacterium]